MMFAPVIAGAAESTLAGGTTKTKITSLDSALQKQALALTASLDGAIQQTKTIAASIDSAVQATVSKTASLDSAIQAARTAAANLDAALQTGQTSAASLDAAIEKTLTATANLDAVLRAGRTITASIDAHITQSGSGTVTAALDAAILVTVIKTTGVDAALQSSRTRFTVDTFTDSNGTALQSHTSDDGGSWTRHAQSDAGVDINIDGNEIWAEDGKTLYYHSATPNSAEYDVRAVFKIIGSAAGFIGITGRMDESAETMYMARYDSTANPQRGWQLFKAVNGSFTELGFAAEDIPAGEEREVVLQIRDATKKVIVDGSEVISSTDNSVTDKGKAGLRSSGSGSTSSAGTHLDGFMATNALNRVSLDAALQSEQILTANLDSAIQAAQTLTASLDAHLTAAGVTAVQTQLDAAIQGLQTAATSLDAAIQRLGITASTSMSAALAKTFELSANLDAAVQKARSVQASLDAAVLASVMATTSLDARIGVADVTVPSGYTFTAAARSRTFIAH